MAENKNTEVIGNEALGMIETRGLVSQHRGCRCDG